MRGGVAGEKDEEGEGEDGLPQPHLVRAEAPYSLAELERLSA